jgi:hypothetical protein
MVGTKFESNVAYGSVPFTSRPGDCCTHIVRWWRHFAKDPVLGLRTDPLFLAIPHRLVCDRDVTAVLTEHQWIREVGIGRHSIEVWWQLAGSFNPFLPRILESAEPSSRGSSTVWKDPQKQAQFLPPLAGVVLG